MSLDISILQVLKYRERFDSLARAVPERAVQPRTWKLLQLFGRYFKQFPGVPVVTASEFMIFFVSCFPKLTDDDKAVYLQIFKSIEPDAEPGIAEGLLRRMLEAATAADLMEKLSAYNDGAEVDLRSSLTGFLERYDTHLGSTFVDPQVRDPIEELVKPEDESGGLRWRLDCLNRCMRPLLPGDFIIVAGRPDKGKTTFLTSELTHMAAQVQRIYSGRRDILWFNNEGRGSRIVTRMFQSALGVTKEELTELAQTPDEKYRNAARRRYIEAVGGRGGVIRVFDIHEWTTTMVEDVVRRFNPALIVFDMLDNVRFEGNMGNGGERTDQILESMYQWGRIRGVKYDCPVIATSQLSADADGVLYPTLPQLKDSKTGKQGAADAIITIGAMNDPSMDSIRGIGTTKNKLRRNGAPASPRTEVIFDALNGLYKDPAQ